MGSANERRRCHVKSSLIGWPAEKMITVFIVKTCLFGHYWVWKKSYPIRWILRISVQLSYLNLYKITFVQVLHTKAVMIIAFRDHSGYGLIQRETKLHDMSCRLILLEHLKVWSALDANIKRPIKGLFSACGVDGSKSLLSIDKGRDKPFHGIISNIQTWAIMLFVSSDSI